MLKLPKIEHRVHWNEGMLLSSQHFQHADLHMETLLAHQLKRVSRFFWGVNRLQYDAVALASGEFRLTGFEGVFPDGSVVQFDSAEESEELLWNQQPVTLNFDELDIAPGSIVTVAVGLAKYNGLCASDTDGVSLQPLLRLGISRDQSPNHTSLPVARVQKMLDGSYQLLAFTPPQIATVVGYTLQEHDLWERLNNLIAKARVKAVQLRSLIVDRRSDQVVLEKQRNRIIALTHGLPALEALLGAQEHPFSVYCKLIDYASDLAALRDDPVPPSFPKYSHNEMETTFLPVYDYVEEVIESVRLDFSILQFSVNSDSNLVCELPPITGGSTLLLAFQVSASADKDRVGEWVESAYICSADNYDELSLRRDIGFDRERVQRFDKFSLVESANELLYQIVLPENGINTLLVSGSDRALDSVRPEVILCFVEQSI